MISTTHLEMGSTKIIVPNENASTYPDRMRASRNACPDRTSTSNQLTESPGEIVRASCTGKRYPAMYCTE
jgi:hypothetical protein